MFTELKLKKYIRQHFDGWSEAYEPGRGGGVGVPDLQLLVKFRLLPVELKLDGNDLSPKQKLWHANFRKAGGVSALIVGSRKDRGPVKLWIREATHGDIKNPRHIWQEINLPLKMFLNQWVPW
jgi:hypothetical protein